MVKKCCYWLIQKVWDHLIYEISVYETQLLWWYFWWWWQRWDWHGLCCICWWASAVKCDGRSDRLRAAPFRPWVGGDDDVQTWCLSWNKRDCRFRGQKFTQKHLNKEIHKCVIKVRLRFQIGWPPVVVDATKINSDDVEDDNAQWDHEWQVKRVPFAWSCW